MEPNRTMIASRDPAPDPGLGRHGAAEFVHPACARLAVISFRRMLLTEGRSVR